MEIIQIIPPAAIEIKSNCNLRRHLALAATNTLKTRNRKFASREIPLPTIAIPLKIPPLRDRLDDVEPLVAYLIDKYNEIDARNVKSLTKGALNTLQKLPFRGNVRELENIIQRAILLSDGQTIKEKDLFLGDGESPIPLAADNRGDVTVDAMTGPLKEVEKKMIFHTLGKTKGNRTHAAKILGISVRTLRNKLNEYRESMEVT